MQASVVMVSANLMAAKMLQTTTSQFAVSTADIVIFFRKIHYCISKLAGILPCSTENVDASSSQQTYTVHTQAKQMMACAIW